MRFLIHYFAQTEFEGDKLGFRNLGHAFLVEALSDYATVRLITIERSSERVLDLSPVHIAHALSRNFHRRALAERLLQASSDDTPAEDTYKVLFDGTSCDCQLKVLANHQRVETSVMSGSRSIPVLEFGFLEPCCLVTEDLYDRPFQIQPGSAEWRVVLLS